MWQVICWQGGGPCRGGTCRDSVAPGLPLAFTSSPPTALGVLGEQSPSSLQSNLPVGATNYLVGTGARELLGHHQHSWHGFIFTGTGRRWLEAEPTPEAGWKLSISSGLPAMLGRSRSRKSPSTVNNPCLSVCVVYQGLTRSLPGPLSTLGRAGKNKTEHCPGGTPPVSSLPWASFLPQVSGKAFRPRSPPSLSVTILIFTIVNGNVMLTQALSSCWLLSLGHGAASAAGKEWRALCNPAECGEPARASEVGLTTSLQDCWCALTLDTLGPQGSRHSTWLPPSSCPG